MTKQNNTKPQSIQRNPSTMSEIKKKKKGRGRRRESWHLAKETKKNAVKEFSGSSP